jgi:hypothetical protein
MTELETSLELLIALGVCQISARPNDERLQRALEVVTRYLELGATRPTISSQQLAVFARMDGSPDSAEGDAMTLLGFSPSFAALLAIWLFGAALAMPLGCEKSGGGPDDHVLDSAGSNKVPGPQVLQH